MGDGTARRYRLGPFTDKELTIIALMAKGLKPLEIMRVMGACRRTMYNRLASAMRKAEAADRPALVRWAVENALDELLPPEDPADISRPEPRPHKGRIKLGRIRRERLKTAPVVR
jgi:DNA-binding CsgD family transcriptional regulator